MTLALGREAPRRAHAQAEEEEHFVFLPRLEASAWSPATPTPTVEIALTLGATVTSEPEPTWTRAPTRAASQTPTPTPVPDASATPVGDPSPSPSASPVPSSTPAATILPTPSPTPDTQPPWLAQLNDYRVEGARLPPVVENAAWSEGARLHSRYMVKTDAATHREDPASPWYTVAGSEAGANGNIYVSADPATASRRAIDWWMSAPFHALALLDPELRASAYGEHREAVGRWRFGATLDIGRGRSAEGPMPDFPLAYPAPESELHLLSFGGGEYPDPLPSCPGYTAPTGPPIYLMLGAGERIPELRNSFLFVAGGGQLPHCAFDETSYRHPDAAVQGVGRAILDGRDAIVILPKAPLRPATTYRVTVDANGLVTSWTFGTAPAGLARQGPIDGRGSILR